MDIKAEEFLHKLQNKLPLPQATQVYVVFGEDDYYRSQLTAALPNYIYGDTDEADRQITVFEKDTDISAVSEAVNTYPFFSGQSLVVLKDDKLWSKGGEEARQTVLDKLTALVNDVPEYCTLLISAPKLDKRTKFYKALKKAALLCECASIRPYELQPWLDAQAELYGARFEHDAIGMIMEYLAPVEKVPLQLLQQEIAKLAVYAGERRQWTRQDILDIFAALPEASDFALTNFIMEGRLKAALEALASARRHGTYVLPLTAMVSAKLRQLARYFELQRSGYDQRSLMQELGVRHPYAMKMLTQQARRFDERRVHEALLAVDQLNIDLRQGGRDFARLEEILIRLLA